MVLMILKYVWRDIAAAPNNKALDALRTFKVQFSMNNELVQFMLCA